MLHRLGSRSRPSIHLGGLERAVELLEYWLEPVGGAHQGITEWYPEQDWVLKGSAFQSIDDGSLWRYVRDHTGEVVPYTVAPHGGVLPTENAPHYRGEVAIGPMPPLGGAAKDRTFVFAFAWHCTGEPEQVTSG